MSANTQGSVMSAAMRKTVLRVVFIAAALNGLVALDASAQDLKPLLDLRGRWAFEVGDDMAWAAPGFSDRGWAQIAVPAAWEDQGFPGYDGYGWYRKWFRMPADWKGKRLFLDLGYVDDADETFVNGHFVGFQGTMPPNYVTKFDVPRRYAIPPYVLKPGEDNLIAVRVYDSEIAGGITHGDVQLLEDRNVLAMDQSLEGAWKLRKGDDLSWKEFSVDERSWLTAQVPSNWETQGLKGYDGTGWYRRTFLVDPKLEGERLILFLGKIDDFDEAYLNGERIGRSGSFRADGSAEGSDQQYSQWRAYTIPTGMLKKGRNSIAVRVFDQYFHGGIYEGPVGLVRRDSYLAWQSRQPREVRSNNNPWRFLQWLFN
jgi:hypothetical protein